MSQSASASAPMESSGSSITAGRTSSAPRGRGSTLAWAIAGLPAGLALTLAASYLAYGALPPVPVPTENPITEPKRVLGKMLFWDEQLSTANVVSCGTCHVPSRAGADNRIARNAGLDQALNTPDDILGSAGVISSNAQHEFTRHPIFALRPQITGRSANSMINSGYHGQLFWDGRAGPVFTDPQTGQVAIVAGGALENQAVGPILNTVEMAHPDTDWNDVARKLRDVQPLDLATNIPADVAGALAGNPDYGTLFERAFGDREITASRIAFAIATYQRTLVSDQTPWDAFVGGNPNALTPQQQQGWQLFQTTARCNQCHTAPLFSDSSFRNIGLRPVSEDNGRQAVTGNVADRGRFKVPSLRNVGLKRTFMHNGQFTTIPSVLQFYARAPGSPPQFPDNQDPLMNQIQLPPQAAQAIGDFITNGLRDPRVANETFPFDRPTLFVDRINDRATPQGVGTPGSGGAVPAIIVQAPPMLGTTMRVGLDNARGGVIARLGISSVEPVNDLITPEEFLEPVQTSGVGNGQGVATSFWYLTQRRYTQGQVLYVQWFINDPGAPGGLARSNPARVPIFCGRSGCPTPCDSIDFNDDGLEQDPTDLEAFLSVYSGGPCMPATNAWCADQDFNNDGIEQDPTDIEAFLSVYSGGPCV